MLEAIAKRPPVIGADGAFGQPGQLEEEHVPGLGDLAARPAQGLEHPAGMGDVEDGQALHHIGVGHRQQPGDCRPPVVSGHARLRSPPLGDQLADVAGQPPRLVGGGLSRLGGQVVAAHIWRDGAKARRGQSRDLVAPAVPEVGKAVEQHDRGTVSRTRLDEVQPNLGQLGISLAQVDVGKHGHPG